jgi:hypothetical protein
MGKFVTTERRTLYSLTPLSLFSLSLISLVNP